MICKLGGLTKPKENVYWHCVAGQNAIRDKDAEHNWVWHILIAFHLDKFGSTAAWEGWNQSGCSWKTASHYVATSAPYGKCVCVKSRRKDPDGSLTNIQSRLNYQCTCISVSARKQHSFESGREYYLSLLLNQQRFDDADVKKLQRHNP